MDSIVSFIVPVYNVQEYLTDCIDSILNQTYKNIEVILVDDGSVDQSPAICDKYEKKDARVHVIHKENGGVSSARNTGIDAASGEYICFVDADDRVTSFYVESVIKSFANHKNADLVVGKTKQIRKEEYTIDSGITEDLVIELTNKKEKEEAVRNVLFLGSQYNGIRGEVWCKAFRKQCFGNLRFDTQVAIGEDQIFLAEYIMRCRKIILKNEVWYFYNIRGGSAMRKADPQKYVKYVKYFQALEKRLRNVVSTDIIAEKAQKMITELANSYGDAPRSKAEIKEILSACKKYKKDKLVKYYLKKLKFTNRTSGKKEALLNKIGISYVEFLLLKAWKKAEK